MKKKYALTGICMMLGLFLFAQETLNTVYEGVEFDMPRVPEPEIPDYAVSIVDYGAVSGGQVKNTEAIARAIGAVAEKGGGKVVIPRGIWLTGPVTLQSRINLHLEAGALLQFSSDFDDYLLVATSFEGLDTYRCISPINGVDLEMWPSQAVAP